ncbi:MAG: hypothetical protein WCK54_15975 [Desulfuromonadales bacterium]
MIKYLIGPFIIYLAALVLALAIVLSLYFLLSDQSIMTLAPITKKTSFNGAVFCIASSSTNGTFKIVQQEKMLEVISKHDGLETIGAWWRTALVVAFMSSTLGWLLGRYMTNDKYKTAAMRKDKISEQKIKEAEEKQSKLSEYKDYIDSVKRDYYERLDVLRRTADGFDIKIAEAVEVGEKERSLRSEVEIKSENDRSYNNKKLEKASARIGEMKSEIKKLKNEIKRLTEE